MTYTEQAARLFVLLFERPLMTVVLIAAITIFVVTLKQAIEDGIEARRERKREEEETRRLLAEIEARNEEVVELLKRLTALAHQQLDGRAIEGEAEQVEQHFARIDELVEGFESPKPKEWVRAVTDFYRYRVRHLVTGVDAGKLDPAVASELLEDVHREATVDLRLKVREDGTVLYKMPRNPDGSPFELQR